MRYKILLSVKSIFLIFIISCNSPENIHFSCEQDFLPLIKGLGLMNQTSWREDRFYYLYDKDLKMVSTWQPESGEGGIVYKVHCGDAGSVLGLMTGATSSVIDPGTGKVLFSMGHAGHEFTDHRLGNPLAAVEENDHLSIYSSFNDSDLNPSLFLYSEF